MSSFGDRKSHLIQGVYVTPQANAQIGHCREQMTLQTSNAKTAAQCGPSLSIDTQQVSENSVLLKLRPLVLHPVSTCF